MEPLSSDDPAEIGGYKLRSRLGAGGMGRVYLASTPGGRRVALKVVRPELGDDPDFRTRFRQEIAAARRVRGLYTAELLNADPEATPPWLVTAYVPGPSLQRAVADHGPMPAETVILLMAGIAEALQAIHEAGVVHRDLKPSNVMLAPDGPRVIDFGIARAAESASVTRSGIRVGSPQFMAPEQIRSTGTTPAVDIFALGSVAAFAATGRAPFGEGDPAALMYRVLNEQPNLTGCSGPVRDLVERCLAKDPAARPSPAQIIDTCRAMAEGNLGDFSESYWPTLSAPAQTGTMAEFGSLSPPPSGSPSPPPGSPSPAPGVPPASRSPRAPGAPRIPAASGAPNAPVPGAPAGSNPPAASGPGISRTPGAPGAPGGGTPGAGTSGTPGGASGTGVPGTSRAPGAPASSTPGTSAASNSPSASNTPGVPSASGAPASPSSAGVVPPEWARPRPSSGRSSGPRRAPAATSSRGPNTGSQPRTATGPRTPTGQRPVPSPTGPGGPRSRTGAPTGPRPYTAPSAPVRPPIPATLNSAAKTMYVGAGLALVGLLAGLGTLGSLRSTIEHQNPNASQAYVSSALGTAIFSIIALGAVGGGLWLLMARLTRRGERRARTLSTMLFALATLIALNLSARGEATALSGALGALEWVTGLIAIILLWSAPSRRYFDSLPPPRTGSPPSRSPSLRERAEQQRNQSAQRR